MISNDVNLDISNLTPEQITQFQSKIEEKLLGYSAPAELSDISRNLTDTQINEVLTQGWNQLELMRQRGLLTDKAAYHMYSQLEKGMKARRRRKGLRGVLDRLIGWVKKLSETFRRD